MDIRKIVNDLNDKLFHGINVEEFDYFQYLEFVETPTGDYVKFMNNYLWDSENDYREYTDDFDYEPLEDYLIREISKVARSATSTHKVLNGE